MTSDHPSKIKSAHALGEAVAAQDPRISHLGDGYISVGPISTEDVTEPRGVLRSQQDGRIIGATIMHPDGTTRAHITDPAILEQIQRGTLSGYSFESAYGTIGPISTEDILKASRSGTTVYIAGPMSGHQDFNYHAFHYAAADLRAAGYRVLNPAENPKPNPDPTWQDWMRAALGQLIQSDAIALLPGWDTSKGAMIEERIGRDLGLDVRPIMHHLPSHHHNFGLYAPSASSKTFAAILEEPLRFTGPGYEAHPGHDHEDCCK